jgi:putative flavoprotein involved in K+ transport
MADYLVAYAEREHAPVRHGIRVDLLDRDADGFVLVAGDHRYHARDVIVATGYLNSPVVPPFASMLDPRIAQLHSIEYRNPSSVPEGPVLIVGGGNSGVEIGLELATTGHEVLLAGHSTFMPTFAQVGGGRVFFGVARRLFTLGTPVGRRMAAATRHHGAPVIRVRPRQLAAAGVERVARVATVTDGRPVLEDGRRPDVASVVWCTGFRPDFSWIRVPVIGEDGYPRQRYGLVPDQPGIAFLGLHFQSSFLSALVGGVGDDAAGIVAGIVRRRSAPTASAAAQPA